VSEAAFWNNVKPVLHGWDAVRVETSEKDGIPDVNHAHGWIELKVADWPVREETCVDFTHYSQQQRVWHRRRAMAGGRVHILCRIGQDILLFRGDVAWNLLGKATKQELIDNASGYWKPGKKWKRELKNAILSDHFDRGGGLFDSG